MGLDRSCYDQLIVCLLTIVTWAIFYCQLLILLTLQLTLLERCCDLLTLLAMTVTLTGGGTVIDDDIDDGQTDSIDNDVGEQIGSVDDDSEYLGGFGTDIDLFIDGCDIIEGFDEL